MWHVVFLLKHAIKASICSSKTIHVSECIVKLSLIDLSQATKFIVCRKSTKAISFVQKSRSKVIFISWHCPVKKLIRYSLMGAIENADVIICGWSMNQRLCKLF